MNLSLQAIAFLVGCAAVFIALAGQEIIVREIKIPRLQPAARVFCGIFGLALIAGSVGELSRFANLSSNSATPSDAKQAASAAATSTPMPSLTSTPAPASTPTIGPIPPLSLATSRPDLTVTPTPDPKPDDAKHITISDSLAEDQEYEHVRVFINDREQFTFSLDKTQRSQQFSLIVRPKDRYSLIGTQAKKVDGQVVTRDIKGSGTFKDSKYTEFRLSEGTIVDAVQFMIIEPNRD